MTQAVDRLLALARLKSLHAPQLTRTDLAALSEQLVSQMKPWVTSNRHEISLSTPDDNCDALVDAVAIEEALRNLIDNAVKHTPDGTRIDVVLRENLDLVVEDNGPGLAGVSTEELSNPFARARARTKGPVSA